MIIEKASKLDLETYPILDDEFLVDNEGTVDVFRFSGNVAYVSCDKEFILESEDGVWISLFAEELRKIHYNGHVTVNNFKIYLRKEGES